MEEGPRRRPFRAPHPAPFNPTRPALHHAHSSKPHRGRMGCRWVEREGDHLELDLECPGPKGDAPAVRSRHRHREARPLGALLRGALEELYRGAPSVEGADVGAHRPLRVVARDNSDVRGRPQGDRPRVGPPAPERVSLLQRGVCLPHAHREVRSLPRAEPQAPVHPARADLDADAQVVRQKHQPRELVKVRRAHRGPAAAPEHLEPVLLQGPIVRVKASGDVVRAAVQPDQEVQAAQPAVRKLLDPVPAQRVYQLALTVGREPRAHRGGEVAHGFGPSQ